METDAEPDRPTIFTEEQLLERVEQFLAAHDIKPSRFGREAMGDPALVFQLRARSRSLSLKNAEKIVRFMDEYIPPESEGSEAPDSASAKAA